MSATFYYIQREERKEVHCMMGQRVRKQCYRKMLQIKNVRIYIFSSNWIQLSLLIFCFFFLLIEMASLFYLSAQGEYVLQNVLVEQKLLFYKFAPKFTKFFTKIYLEYAVLSDAQKKKGQKHCFFNLIPYALLSIHFEEMLLFAVQFFIHENFCRNI